MKISIENLSCMGGKDDASEAKKELIDLQESLLADTVVGIQKQFLEESKDYNLLVKNLRAWTKCHEQDADIKAVIEVANEIRDNFKAEAFVTIGIGGSDLGSRTLHACLNHTQHNLLTKEQRGGAPEVYFTGDTFDPYELHDILDVLEKKEMLLSTIYNVISKSGTTSETIAAFLIIRDRLMKKLKETGRDENEYAQYFVVTTGLNEKSALFNLNLAQPVKFRALLPVPDGVGGRFSFASPVGLLFLAVTANKNVETVEERVASAVRGLSDGEKAAYGVPKYEENVAANLAVANFLAEKKRKGTVVFYPYAKTLKLIGDWYTQLSTESLQELGQGQNVVCTCGPTGNHSILNGIIGGPRDKIVIFIKVDEYDNNKDFIIPSGSGLSGGLEVLENKSMSFIQNASQLGTEINCTENGVPSVTINISRIDVYNIIKLMYTLECSVAYEGELRKLGRITYEQAGVEGYKIETKKVLSQS